MARAAWLKAGVMRQAVMGHQRLFFSGARLPDLWIPPTPSDHYALDGEDGGDQKNGHKMLMKKVSMSMLLCLWKTSVYFKNAFILLACRFQHTIQAKCTASFYLLPKIHLPVQTSLQMKLIKLSEAFTSQRCSCPRRHKRPTVLYFTSR